MEEEMKTRLEIISSAPVEILNGKVVTNSLKVSNDFGKRHDHVLRDIDNVLTNPNLGALKNEFITKEYLDAKGEKRKYYELGFNAFTLLVMGFKGEKAMNFKIKYVEIFNLLLNRLKEIQTEEHKQLRLQSKETRKNETDAIKELVEYATNKGSKNASKYYVLLSNLANKTAGIEKGQRDLATTEQLVVLQACEMIINNESKAIVEAGDDYHNAFKNSKEKLTILKEITKNKTLIGG